MHSISIPQLVTNYRLLIIDSEPGHKYLILNKFKCFEHSERARFIFPSHSLCTIKRRDSFCTARWSTVVRLVLSMRNHLEALKLNEWNDTIVLWQTIVSIFHLFSRPSWEDPFQEIVLLFVEKSWPDHYFDVMRGACAVKLVIHSLIEKRLSGVSVGNKVELLRKNIAWSIIILWSYSESNDFTHRRYRFQIEMISCFILEFYAFFRV
jgi:hypothetical protein